jgi:hypothetical protein
LPIGIHTFSDFIAQNYLYVDKTKDIHNLFAWGGKYYFLSRPRRFGKSLLISTLKEIFSGYNKLACPQNLPNILLQRINELFKRIEKESYFENET